jgi:hypothetical protein
MNPMTGLIRNLAKPGMTSPAAPRMTRESLKLFGLIAPAITHHRGNWPQYPVFWQKKACASAPGEWRHLELKDRVVRNW